VVVGLALGLAFYRARWWKARGTLLRIMGKSAFGSGYDFGMTLFYTTPLIFAGLSVCGSRFKPGCFNIGGRKASSRSGAPRRPVSLAQVWPGFARGRFARGLLAGGWASVCWPGFCWGRDSRLVGAPGRGSHEVIKHHHA